MMVEAAADRVGEKLPAERADEVLPVRDQQRAQTGDAFEPRAVGEHRRRIDRHAVAGGTPLANRVEVLQRKPSGSIR
jgi:hypothetical protein